jgi:hypothetical protein
MQSGLPPWRCRDFYCYLHLYRTKAVCVRVEYNLSQLLLLLLLLFYCVYQPTTRNNPIHRQRCCTQFNYSKRFPANFVFTLCLQLLITATTHTNYEKKCPPKNAEGSLLGKMAGWRQQIQFRHIPGSSN